MLGRKQTIFENWYNQNYNELFIMKRHVKRTWKASKTNAIVLLRSEASKSQGRKKVILKAAANLLLRRL